MLLLVKKKGNATISGSKNRMLYLIFNSLLLNAAPTKKKRKSSAL